MKIQLEVDLTPQEFRQAMGWPDVTQFQQSMMDDIKSKMEEGIEGYDAMSMMKPFLNQSSGSMDSFQKLMSGMMEAYFNNNKQKFGDKS